MAPLSNQKISFGKLGEAVALNFLKNKGYTIIEKNFRTRYGEIDIIAKDKNCLVFIEVKCRKNMSFGFGRESITPIKQKKIKQTALFYLQRCKINYANMRFDVVEILIQNEKPEVTLIKEAF